MAAACSLLLPLQQRGFSTMSPVDIGKLDKGRYSSPREGQILRPWSQVLLAEDVRGQGNLLAMLIERSHSYAVQKKKTILVKLTGS